ncbi:MAG: tetratricopeptide repeat protein [Bacteroidales bacterium]|nr:tetratricopeptide repeat protein [Bacteroidales bacterium]
MKQTFLILTFFLCGLCCFGQTTITEKYFNKIDGAYKNAEWEKVLQYCDSIDYYKIDGFPYALLKAEALAGLERYDDAISYLKSGKNADGIEPYYITNTLGNVYWLKGDLETAISQYETTIELRPSYARPYVYLGYIYQQLEQKDKAVECFMGAIELFYANNLLDEVEEFTKIIISELDSTYIYAYLYLERVYHEKGNFRYAMSVCSDIDKLCEQYEVEVPILIENVFHTGENIFFLNDYESSSVVFLEYLNMLEYYRDPEYNSECEAYVYLGLISEHSDEKRKAEKYFKKARKISKERTDYLLKYIADKNDN